MNKEEIRSNNSIKENIKYFDDSIIIINVKETETYKNLQQRIDKATNKLYEWGEALDPEFQKIMLDILKGVK